eukprot:930648-Pyramimonas_sp.AAC.1
MLDSASSTSQDTPHLAPILVVQRVSMTDQRSAPPHFQCPRPGGRDRLPPSNCKAARPARGGLRLLS